MGSGTSRGKKVAPACVSEVSLSKAAASSSSSSSRVASSKRDNRAFKPLHIHAILRNARNRAQPDCHSEGHDSELSAEDEDMDRGLDTVLTDYEERERSNESKTHPKRFFVRSKTYGLCHLRRGDAEEPRGDVNKMSDAAFNHLDKHTPPCTSQHSAFGPSCVQAVPTSDKQSSFDGCNSSSLTTPVILYDGSEEELMDTIEREFS
ncbi:uncharacterized protein LOC143006380 [Genypterus blacodes]|uniref:uncharacterized protein LOC143006380 n=1 Tax=Genypterus blacodes TaxID=154954 RepID=UPI003F76E496